jgi:NAD(P) transhydrogenase
MSHHDVVILGAGPGGERAAIQAARAGKSVALVERAQVVGGTRVNWGTIPSKTLRESALFVRSFTTAMQDAFDLRIGHDITMPELSHRRRTVVERELELVNQALDRYAVELIHGRGRLLDPHTVAVLGVDGRERLRLTGQVIVLAVGTRPHHPPDVPFDGETVLDSDTILDLGRLPRSLIVLGAGVIGVEYAAIFASLGVQVTLVDPRAELLPYLDREIASLLLRELRRLGIAFVPNDRYARIERVAGDLPAVRCRTRGGNLLEADALLYCVGRDGNTEDLGLEALGIRPDERGLLQVNEHFQTVHPHIYAVGDVIGYPALASTSAEQGRQAIRHAFGLPGVRGRAESLPFAIFAIPEVSYVGETEEGLRARGVSYVVGRGRYDHNPRGQILGEMNGVLKLLFEAGSLRLLGVHVIGYGASELVHVGQAFLRSEADAELIAETLFNYPTLSDLYRHAAQEALAASRRRLSRSDA